MAANYWDSSQRRYWTFTRQELADIRQRLEDKHRHLVQLYPLPDRRLLNIFFCQQLQRFSKRGTLGTKQQALATAQVYMRRFYSKVEIRETNPYLVLSTALYLACKVEECPQHIRHVVGEARQTWPDVITSDTSKMGETEFALISVMSSQLIVHHPYRTLLDLSPTFNLSPDELSLAWWIINDHYVTDLPLLHSPHVIALTAALLAVVLNPVQAAWSAGKEKELAAMRSGGAAAMRSDGDPVQKVGAILQHGMHQNRAVQAAMQSVVQAALGSAFSGGGAAGQELPGSGNTGGAGGAPTPALSAKVQKMMNWLAESEVDIEAMVDCTQEMISLYEVWETYKEKDCKEVIGKFVKGRGLDK
ncbi:cyclin-like protein [Eremomyces bilateralis CBS 781.70]|uniref:RNA polymerase II holoenzyme cyclin-like subunit n=1 Tax=Eremomyces bilateralis CBS 781.70 TaxID=1392243 RepID=A0A6G1G7Y9_9PEZI|nr:cyclin-like protein [Eremomyces bilateralis CBS 781.70]KAF1814112.1 cyclin-like protein [Eremomyces bilateralis CBS 781.70]